MLGLQSLFGSKVQIAALGKKTQVRRKNPDFTLELGMRDFGISDIMLLAEALNLTETAAALSSIEEVNASRRTVVDDGYRMPTPLRTAD